MIAFGPVPARRLGRSVCIEDISPQGTPDDIRTHADPSRG